MAARLRALLVGLAQEDLDALVAQTTAADAVEIAGEALLRDVEQGRLPASGPIEAIVLTPAAWAASRDAPPPRRRAVENRGERAMAEELTGRERDVLALVADGRSNRQIAAELGISDHTVKFHLASIFGKLGVATRTQAVRRALDWSLIDI